ncbi:MAG TPA: sialate O-acetylesterase, partial [Verrucomicrobiae bacterium]|nr:sialate O-acetylesterase [Verrucomicrobiae bacterium]
ANPEEYKSRFFSLIKNYRKNWDEGDFPFLYVQIASFGPTQTNVAQASGWAPIRQTQTDALSLPHTAMAVTIDIGAVDYHPEDKWDVGKRLALPALRLVYGRTNISESSGPMLQSAVEKDGKVFLRFNHATGGLVDKDKNSLPGFAVCGVDSQWHWANGVIQQDAVVLSCDEVKKPVKVRYAWADCPIATPLYNGAGLPAVPFQVDLK